jgi:hypothetical protein
MKLGSRKAGKYSIFDPTANKQGELLEEHAK